MHRKRLKRDAIVNLVLAISVAAALLLVVREAGHFFSAAVLGIFLIARRFADSLSNLVQLGMPLGLKRYLALGDNPTRHARYLTLATSTVLGSGVIALLAATLTAPTLHRILFSPDSTEGIVVATVALAVALSLNNLALSSLTAYRRFGLMNLVSFANGSGWILLGLAHWRAQATADGILLFHATCATLLSLAVLGFLWARARLSNAEAADPTGRTSQPDAIPLAAYALPRTFAPFAETLIFAVAAWLLHATPVEAGYLILATTLLRMVNAALQPIGDVAAVTTANLQGLDRHAAVHRGTNLLVGAFSYFGAGATAVGVPWLALFLRLWLDNPGLEGPAYGYCLVALWTVVPYALYQGLKGVVDMLWSSPRNLYACLIGLGVLLAVWFVTHEFMPFPDAAMLATAGAVTSVGAVTMFWLGPSLERAAYFGFARAIAIAALLFAVNSVIASMAQGLAFRNQLLCAAATVTASCAVGIALLVKFNRCGFLRDARAFFDRPKTDIGAGRASGGIAS